MMLFTKYIDGNYSYVSPDEFDRSIRTDSDIKRLCRARGHFCPDIKRQLPAYRFVSNIENSDFLIPKMNQAIDIPNELIDYGSVQQTGLMCIDVDHIAVSDVNKLKKLAPEDKNIKYLALSTSETGCFILYQVENNAQFNYKLSHQKLLIIKQFIRRAISPVSSFLIDPICLHPLVIRLESYDSNPYCNFM